MRRAGQVVREVLELVRGKVRPGATTLDLERAAEARLKELGVKAAFKGYHGFPCVLCTSVNSEVVHGIPSQKRVLKEGDIVSVDFGAIVDGYFGDAAITVPVGAIDPDAARLLAVTEKSLHAGIAAGIVEQHRNAHRKPGVSHRPRQHRGRHRQGRIRCRVCSCSCLAARRVFIRE